VDGEEGKKKREEEGEGGEEGIGSYMAVDGFGCSKDCELGE
jgi:hypothetical protein